MTDLSNVSDLPMELVNKILIMRPRHPLAVIIINFNRDLSDKCYPFLPLLFVKMKSFYLPDVFIRYVIQNKIVD